jgi:hypothetical protein
MGRHKAYPYKKEWKTKTVDFFAIAADCPATSK